MALELLGNGSGTARKLLCQWNMVQCALKLRGNDLWLAKWCWNRSRVALKLLGNCSGTARELHCQWNTVRMAKLDWNFPGIALELPWNCPGTALELHCQWNTIEGAPKLLGNQLRVAKLLWDWYWKFSSVIALELLWDCTVSGTRIEGAPDLLGNELIGGGKGG